MINIELINSLNVSIMFLANVVFISFWGAVLANYKMVKGYFSLFLIFIATSLFSVKATIIFVKYISQTANELIMTFYPIFDVSVLICFFIIVFINWEKIDKRYSYSYILVILLCIFSLIFNFLYFKLLMSYIFIFMSYLFYMAVIISLKLSKKK